MAASRPSIDLDEDIAALLERARVSAPVSGKVVPQLLALDVGKSGSARSWSTPASR